MNGAVEFVAAARAAAEKAAEAANILRGVAGTCGAGESAEAVTRAANALTDAAEDASSALATAAEQAQLRDAQRLPAQGAFAADSPASASGQEEVLFPVMRAAQMTTPISRQNPYKREIPRQTWDFAVAVGISFETLEEREGRGACILCGNVKHWAYECLEFRRFRGRGSGDGAMQNDADFPTLRESLSQPRPKRGLSVPRLRSARTPPPARVVRAPLLAQAAQASFVAQAAQAAEIPTPAQAPKDARLASPTRGDATAKDFLGELVHHRCPHVRPADLEWTTRWFKAAQPGAPAYKCELSFLGSSYEGELCCSEAEAQESAAELALRDIADGARRLAAAPQPAASPSAAAAPAAAAPAVPAAPDTAPAPAAADLAKDAAAEAAPAEAAPSWEALTGLPPPYFVGTVGREGFKLLVTGLPPAWAAQAAQAWAGEILQRTSCAPPSHASVIVGDILMTFSASDAAERARVLLAGHGFGGTGFSQASFWTPAGYDAYASDPRFAGIRRAA